MPAEAVNWLPHTQQDPAPRAYAACDLSACRARARTQPAVHIPDAAIGDRLILARTSNSGMAEAAKEGKKALGHFLVKQAA
jgi:hypothetical protein